MAIDDYYRIAKITFDEVKEENLVNDYYKMYLTLLPLMIRKEIENISFKDFLEQNRPKKIETSIKQTTKTDKEILDEVNKYTFV